MQNAATQTNPTKLTQAVKEGTQQGKHLLDRAQDETDTLKSRFLDEASAVKEVVRDFGERAGEMAASVRDGVEHYQDATGKYVRANPVTSLAIAAGTGLLLGGLIMAMRRKA